MKTTACYTERMQMPDDLQEDIVWTDGIGYHPTNDYGPDCEDEFDGC
jgi:hypothetical protein